MNLPKELLEKIKTLLQQISSKHTQTNTLNAQGNNIYLQIALDEDERHDIEDICDEIDLYYQERSRFNASGKKAYQWFEQEAINLYLQEHPNVSNEEQQEYLSELRSSLDKVLLGNTRIFAEEATSDSYDDEALEVKTKIVEQQLLEGKDIILISASHDIQGKEEQK